MDKNEDGCPCQKDCCDKPHPYFPDHICDEDFCSKCAEVLCKNCLGSCYCAL